MANSRKQVIAFVEEYIASEFSAVDRRTKQLLRLHLINLLGRLHRKAPVLPVSTKVQDLIQGLETLSSRAKTILRSRGKGEEKATLQRTIEIKAAELTESICSQFRADWAEFTFQQCKISGYEYAMPTMAVKQHRRGQHRSKRTRVDLRGIDDGRKANPHIYLHTNRLVELVKKNRISKPTSVLAAFLSQARERLPALELNGPHSAKALNRMLLRGPAAGSFARELSSDDIDFLAAELQEEVITF